MSFSILYWKLFKQLLIVTFLGKMLILVQSNSSFGKRLLKYFCDVGWCSTFLMKKDYSPLECNLSTVTIFRFLYKMVIFNSQFVLLEFVCWILFFQLLGIARTNCIYSKCILPSKLSNPISIKQFDQKVYFIYRKFIKENNIIIDIPIIPDTGSEYKK